MKTSAFRVVRNALLLATLVPTMASAVAPGFFEDFEGSLAQWTGKNGGPHSGQTILDPLSSGQGAVLRFNGFGSGGDLFASSAINMSGPIEIAFDYLGLPDMGGTPGDLGGFLGIAYSLAAETDGVDLFWYAGTQSYLGLLVDLVDDGAWHRYSFVLNASAIQPFHLILEDFAGSGGVIQDVFFDNISVMPVPEPAVATLTLGGLLLALRRRA